MTGKWRDTPVLAKKFFLFLEVLIDYITDTVLEVLVDHITDTAQYPDGGPKIVSGARHVPIKLPELDGPKAA